MFESVFGSSQDFSKHPNGLRPRRVVSSLVYRNGVRAVRFRPVEVSDIGVRVDEQSHGQRHGILRDGQIIIDEPKIYRKFVCRLEKKGVGYVDGKLNVSAMPVTRSDQSVKPPFNVQQWVRMDLGNELSVREFFNPVRSIRFMGERVDDFFRQLFLDGLDIAPKYRDQYLSDFLARSVPDKSQVGFDALVSAGKDVDEKRDPVDEERFQSGFVGRFYEVQIGMVSFQNGMAIPIFRVHSKEIHNFRNVPEFPATVGKQGFECGSFQIRWKILRAQAERFGNAFHFIQGVWAERDGRRDRKKDLRHLFDQLRLFVRVLAF